jgi:predicted ATP-dependent endonuclease of OLD family
MSDEQISGWKIVELTIEGFRRFQRRHTWSFKGPDEAPLDVIILSGPSGSGKTSILEALLIALGALETPRVDGAHVRVVLERWQLEGSSYRSCMERREVSWAGVASKHQRPTHHEIDYFSSWRAPVLGGGVKPKTSGRHKKNNDENRLYLLKEHIISSLARSGIVKNSNPSSGESILTTINKIWKKFSFNNFSEHALIEADEVDRQSPTPEYDLYVIDGARRICVDALSAGEIELLQLAGSLALGLLGPRQLLVVDEPELHLDQSLQSAWLSVVREATGISTQLIVASHSEEIWGRAYSYERFLLVNVDDPRAVFPAAHGGIRP